MDVSNITVLPVVLLDTYVNARYCTKLVRRQIAPRLATWLIFEVGVLMSLAAYFASPGHSLAKAALNATDAVMVTVILLLVLVKQKGRKAQLTKNEGMCLLIACLAAALWLFTRTGWVGLKGFKVVMSVAYLPTLESVWKWRPRPPPEPWTSGAPTCLSRSLGSFLR